MRHDPRRNFDKFARLFDEFEEVNVFHRVGHSDISARVGHIQSDTNHLAGLGPEQNVKKVE